MCVEDSLSPCFASVAKEKKDSHRVICYYLGLDNVLVIKNKFDKAISENDVAFLRYVEPSNMTPQRYAKNLITKPCKVADV